MSLARILGIASLDLEYINELLEVIEDNQFGYDLRDEFNQMTLAQLDANLLIHFIFERINQAVFHLIEEQIKSGEITVSNETEKEDLLALCHQRVDEFSPFINAMDSHFNNELDETTIQGNTLKRIVDVVVPVFLENARS